MTAAMYWAVRCPLWHQGKYEAHRDYKLALAAGCGVPARRMTTHIQQASVNVIRKENTTATFAGPPEV